MQKSARCPYRRASLKATFSGTIKVGISGALGVVVSVVGNRLEFKPGQGFLHFTYY